jgi:D-alanine-D-alanine ligase
MVRVGVIGGGVSCEHDVSVASAEAVAEALVSRGYRVDRFTIERDGRWSLNGHAAAPASSLMPDLARCDAAFPVLHGPAGEDGTIAAVCEMLGVPYAGSGVMAGAVAMDKWAAKCAASALGLVVARGILLTGPARDALERPELAAWEGPAVAKPVAAGSSYGVTLVNGGEAELRAAVREAFLWDLRVLVEQVVRGRELDVAVWPDGHGGYEAGPVLEIVGDGIFDTRTKYDGSARFDVPADLSRAQADALARSALAVFTALGCKGIARVDFFLQGDVVVFNEINTTPGLTTHSQVPRMYAAAGGEYAELVERALLAAAPDLRGDHRALAVAREQT